jgi:antitoxin component of MazEF toxin-antitoxin module
MTQKLGGSYLMLIPRALLQHSILTDTSVAEPVRKTYPVARDTTLIVLRPEISAANEALCLAKGYEMTKAR